MAKFTSTAVLDGSLDAVGLATEMYLCAGQPASRADAIARALAPATVLDAADFAKSAEGTGRKVTVASQVHAAATAAGSADHVAFCSGAALLWVTTLPATAVTVGLVLTTNALNFINPQAV